jgi:ABC-type thiamine transport system substrate-binding protein
LTFVTAFNVVVVDDAAAILNVERTSHAHWNADVGLGIRRQKATRIVQQHP